MIRATRAATYLTAIILAMPWVEAAPQATATAAVDHLERGRSYARWFLEAKIDSIAPFMTEGFPGGPARLREIHAQFTQRAGTEHTLVQEQVVWQAGDRQYWRTGYVDSIPDPILLRIVLMPDGRFAGLGLGPASNAPIIDSAGAVLRATVESGIAVDTMGPGTISSPGAQNYQGAFSPDGRTFYFFRHTGNGNTYQILTSTRGAGGWSTPERLMLGGDFSDLYPAISSDGRFLVFSSYRTLPGHDNLPPQAAHLWIAERSGAGWGTPRPIEELNRPGYYHSGVRFEGDSVLSWVTQTPSYSGRENRRARWSANTFASPEAYTFGDWERRLPTGVHLWRTTVHPAGDLAILGVGNSRSAPGDLWVSIREGTEWSSPVRLPDGINGPGWENFEVFSPDGSRLHFIRDFGTILEVAVGDLRRLARQAAP